jgi:hypothetical protein
LGHVKDGHFQKRTFSTLGELQIVTKSGTTVLDYVVPDLGKDFISTLLATLNSKK